MNPLSFGGMPGAMADPDHWRGSTSPGLSEHRPVVRAPADKGPLAGDARRKALAAALSGAMPQVPQQQMEAGGMAVPMSMMGGIAQGLQPLQDHLRQKRIADLLDKRAAPASGGGVS